MTKKFFAYLFTSTSFLLSTTKTFAAVQIVPQTNGFATLSDLTVVFANVLSTVSTFAGFAVLIMFIRGGVAYITAQGDPKGVAAARNTLTWAIVGLIVIISAYLIISLLVGFVAIPGLGKFCLPKAGQEAATQCS